MKIGQSSVVFLLEHLEDTSESSLDDHLPSTARLQPLSNVFEVRRQLCERAEL